MISLYLANFNLFHKVITVLLLYTSLTADVRTALKVLKFIIIILRAIRKIPTIFQLQDNQWYYNELEENHGLHL